MWSMSPCPPGIRRLWSRDALGSGDGLLEGGTDCDLTRLANAEGFLVLRWRRPWAAVAAALGAADRFAMSVLEGSGRWVSLPLDQAGLERLCIRNLLSSSAERIFFKDRDSRLLLASAGWCSAYAAGRPLAELIGRSDADVFTDAHAEEAFADEQEIIRSGEPIIGKLERETFCGRDDAWVSTTKLPLRDDDGRIIGTYGISRDVTEQVHLQQMLAEQARRDEVTGLANRLALTERLTEALGALESGSGRVGVLFIDLDGFKEINDTRGHGLGDRLLTAVGQRISLAVRADDTVARIGGDEFVVLTGVAGEQEQLRLAARIHQALLVPLLGEQGDTVTASIGIAWTADATTRPDALLARADAAMYAAKRGGNGGMCSYDDSLTNAGRGLPTLLEDLRGAIARHELTIVYQPIIRLADGALAGTEALVRWDHPVRGRLTPNLFIPLAERNGLVAVLDSHVLECACRQLRDWQQADPGWERRTVAVNLSGLSLLDPARPGRVLGTLRRYGLSPERLCLEITETALIGEMDCARRVIASLSRLGVRIALDDFGTGYSTLAHLQQLEADTIKIDRSFVTRLGGRPRDRQIVAAVTAMAHALGMSVIGEGVESIIERDALTAMGCDEAQGYLFARPCEAAQIAALARTATRTAFPLAA